MAFFVGLKFGSLGLKFGEFHAIPPVLLGAVQAGVREGNELRGGAIARGSRKRRANAKRNVDAARIQRDMQLGTFEPADRRRPRPRLLRLGRRLGDRNCLENVFPFLAEQRSP